MFKFAFVALVACIAYANAGIIATPLVAHSIHPVPVVRTVPVVHAAPIVPVVRTAPIIHTVPVVKTAHVVHSPVYLH